MLFVVVVVVVEEEEEEEDDDDDEDVHFSINDITRKKERKRTVVKEGCENGKR